MSGTSRTLDLLLLLAVVALVVTAASQQWLQKLTTPIGQIAGDPTPLPSIGQAILCTLAGIPILGGAFKGACSGGSTSVSSSGSSGGGGGSNALVGHYTVGLAGGGNVTVNASDPTAAAINAAQETHMGTTTVTSA